MYNRFQFTEDMGSNPWSGVDLNVLANEVAPINKKEAQKFMKESAPVPITAQEEYMIKRLYGLD